MISSPAKIRIEIILPLKYNNGRSIERAKFLRTKRELVERFNACNILTRFQGSWLSPKSNRLYDEPNAGFWVDATDDRNTKDFLRLLKSKLKRRFRQEDIYIVVYPVQTI